MNNTVLGLNKLDKVNLELLFADQWLEDGEKLPESCPLRDLPFHTFPMNERLAERAWKLTGFPKMDRWVAKDTDWIYAPMETLFPVRKKPVAITIYDMQAFETDLEWSESKNHKRFRSRWQKWVPRAVKESTIIFTISDFSRRRIIELLQVPENKVINVGCGVEQSFYKIASKDYSELAVPTDSSYVFMVGGLRQKKGGDYYLKVAEELKRQNSEVKILIAGPNDPAFENKAAGLENIQLLGMVSDNDLPVLMRGSNALLFLSLYEGFGIPPLESMAAGVPVIVSDRASLPEVVGDAGIIVDLNNIGSIVDAITQLVENKSLHQELVSKGKKRLEMYSWDKTAKKIYNTLVEHG